jgi:hypothetical protein
MKLTDAIDGRLRVDLSRDELLIVNAALNEVLNGIAVFEFETRIGTTRDRVNAAQGCRRVARPVISSGVTPPSRESPSPDPAR